MNGWTRFPLCLPAIQETTAKGTGLVESAAKEHLVEFDSSLTQWRDIRGIE